MTDEFIVKFIGHNILAVLDRVTFLGVEIVQTLFWSFFLNCVLSLG
jgi:hypothetical protein